MASPHPVIVDGDALWLIAEMGAPWKRSATTIATPHAGEFGHVYGDEGDKVSATRAAAVRTGDVIVFKGADTVLAAPDGRAAIAPGAPHWLASAGTGDVLAGVIAARLASGLDGLEAACAGTWLHGRAAALAGPALIADDLIARLPAAVAECL
jgi:NAD(P)H-hydrate repair Nnr-like enzyme with NAD(P)H-hydrate dehydratase domain